MSFTGGYIIYNLFAYARMRVTRAHHARMRVYTREPRLHHFRGVTKMGVSRVWRYRVATWRQADASSRQRQRTVTAIDELYGKTGRATRKSRSQRVLAASAWTVL